MKTNSTSKLVLRSILISILTAATLRAGTIYYVASDGSDSNNGTSISTPFTFSKAFDGSHVQAGDTVYVRGGVYRPHTADNTTGTLWTHYLYHEALRTNPSWTDFPSQAISGTAANMITVQAYGTEKPILKGSVTIDHGAWTHVGSGAIYRTPWNPSTDDNLSDDYPGASGERFSNCQQVFASIDELHDGVALRQISWPSLLNASDAAIDDQVGSNYMGIGQPATATTGRPSPDYAAYAFYNGKNQSAMDTEIAGVMTQGSFFYDHHNHQLYVWLPDDSNPGTTTTYPTIEASTAQAIALFDDYYHIKGLAFRHSNCPIDNGGAVGVGAHCIVENCDIEWTSTWGTGGLYGTKCVGCIISHNGQTGAGIGARNVTFQNCLIEGNNYRGFSRSYACGGIKATNGAFNATIENCEFKGNFGVAAWFDGAPENDLVYIDQPYRTHSNDVDSVAIIRNNFIHDNVGYPVTSGSHEISSAYGIYMEVTKGAKISYNLLLRNTTGGIEIQNSSRCSIHDNIVASTQPGGNGDPDDSSGVVVFSSHRKDTNYDRDANPDKWYYVCEDNEIFNNIIVDNWAVDIDTNYDIGFDPTPYSETGYAAHSMSTVCHRNKCDYNVYFLTGGGFLWRSLNNWDSSLNYDLPTWNAATTYDEHSVEADPGFAAAGGLDDLIAQLQIVNSPTAGAPAVVADVPLGTSTEALGSLVFDAIAAGGLAESIGSTQFQLTDLSSRVSSLETRMSAAEGAITSLETSKADQSDLTSLTTTVGGKASQSDLTSLTTTVGGKAALASGNSWAATQALASGFNWEAGPSDRTPGTDLRGGFLYRADTGQTNSRNWLLTGDSYAWGDYGLFVSTSNTGNPALARYYHDGVSNLTTIGHNANSTPSGTDTLNIEGTTSLIPPQAGSTGAPTSRVLVLGTQTTNGTVTELTTDGGSPGSTNRIVLSYNRTATITATIMGRQATGGSVGLSKYIVKALYVKGNGSSLTLGGSDTLGTFAESGTTSWGFSFDVSSNVVRIKVNGAASTTVNWSARVEVTEVGN